MTTKTDWLAQPNSDQLFAYPVGVRYLIHTIPLSAELLVDTLDARIATYLWWNIHGRLTYQELSWELSQEEYAYLQTHEVDGALRYMPNVAVQWLRSNKALGFKVSEGYAKNLMKPVQVEGLDESCILPKFIQMIYEDRQDLKQFDLRLIFHYWVFLKWWDHYGQFEYPRLAWSTRDNVLTPLLAPVTLDNGLQLPKFLVLLFRHSPNLKDWLEPSTEANSGLVDWWQTKGKQENPFFENVDLFEVSANVYSAEEVELNGVNVVGFAQGVLGLGEDARLLGDCCVENDVPVAMINAPIAGPEKVIELKPEWKQAHYPQYNTTVFCLPPTEMMRLGIEIGRPFIDFDAYNIGACPWELPNWPVMFANVRNFVDEFWAQSEYVKNCLAKQGDTPTYKMPIAVTMPTPTENVRSRFDLPADSYLFYLMFDGNSWLTRKNPLAGVQAFQKAFSDINAEKKVGLVIKAMNINPDNKDWQKIEKIVSADPRINVITEKLSRQDVVNFMDSCDSYISLHRSEGFGRVIAEAMLLKQPVIATNFSGNVDFCHPDTAFLVDGELVPLKPKDYLFTEGQYWCDPEVEIAAEQIKRVYHDQANSAQIAQKGANYIAEHYSVSTVAALQMQRLQEIWARK